MQIYSNSLVPTSNRGDPHRPADGWHGCWFIGPVVLPRGGGDTPNMPNLISIGCYID